jgi:hypothetical protein
LAGVDGIIPNITPVAPTPVAPTPVAPTPVSPTPVSPTPVAPTPVIPTLLTYLGTTSLNYAASITSFNLLKTTNGTVFTAQKPTMPDINYPVNAAEGGLGLAYGNNKYSMVNIYDYARVNRKVAFSNDFANWTYSYLPTLNTIAQRAIFHYNFLNNRFIVFPSTGLPNVATEFAYTTDGTNWLKSQFPVKYATPSSIENTAYGNGFYVAAVRTVSGSGEYYYFMKSTNGVNWQFNATVYENLTPAASDLMFCNGVFCIALYTGTSGNRTGLVTLTSTDGTTWVKTNFVTAQAWRFSCADDKFFALFGNTIYISQNGKNWVAGNTLPITRVWGDVVRFNNKYTCVPDYCSTVPAYQRLGIYSLDRANWYAYPLPLDTPTVWSTNSTFCTKKYYLTVPVSPTPVAPPVPPPVPPVTKLVYIGTKTLNYAANESDFDLLETADGTTFSLKDPAMPDINYPVNAAQGGLEFAYGNNTFSMVNELDYTNINRKVAFSSDFVTWTYSYLPTLNTIALNQNFHYNFLNDKFIVFPNTGNTGSLALTEFAYTPNGTNWVKTTFNVSDMSNTEFYSSAYGKVNNVNCYVAGYIKSNSIPGFLRSSDGITWRKSVTLYPNYMPTNVNRKIMSVNVAGNTIFCAAFFLIGVPRNLVTFTSTNGGGGWTIIDCPFYSITKQDWKFSSANNYFFALYEDTVHTSTDGRNWSPPRTLPISRTWGEVQYIGGKYVCVPDYCSSIPAVSRLGIYSTDLLNWNTFTLPINPTFCLVANCKSNP